jgi:hypothetical protein
MAKKGLFHPHRHFRLHRVPDQVRIGSHLGRPAVIRVVTEPSESFDWKRHTISFKIITRFILMTHLTQNVPKVSLKTLLRRSNLRDGA